MSEKTLNCFINRTIEHDFSAIVKGIFTGDNARFLRIWNEVEFSLFGKKWKPYSKGGNFRRWYGNLEYVINWDNNGYELSHFDKSGLGAAQYFGSKTIVWTKLTSYKTGFRLNDCSVYFDDASPALVQKQNNVMEYYLAFLNSIIATELLFILSPTLNFQCGEIRKLPIIIERSDVVNRLATENIQFSKSDWDSFETSWDFKKHPLV